ncbi:ankyrin repeat domain-containing protein [Roseovarius sp.]|uniref:ankyrin repeat domain-containing protein n=1 Tax=Roseovarius sp. TaxID=1486281 RepID=UPI003A97CA46
MSAAATRNFVELAHIAGLNPARDFVHLNLSGVDFSGSNLRGFHLAGSDLTRANFAGAFIGGASFDADQLALAELSAAVDYDDFIQENRLGQIDLRRRFLRACELGMTSLLPEFLEAGIRVDDEIAFAGSRRTALIHVLRNGTMFGNASIQFLLENGADVNHAVGAWTPLIAAIGASSLGWAEEFLSLGADPNALADDGRTPLFEAVTQYAADICSVLIDAGADVNFSSPRYGTARAWAERFNKPEIVEVLVAAGAR